MKPLNKETRKLIEASIDGSSTPAQEARLSNILAESKEAASLHRHLLELEHSLQAEKASNHHIDVADKVMQKISAKQQPAFSFKPFLNSISGLFNYFPMQYAVAVLVGIVIGTAFTWFLSGPLATPQVEMLSGSMVAGKQETLSFTKDNTSLKIIPYEIEGMVYLNFVVNSHEDVEIVVEYDDFDIALRNANYISAAGNQFTEYGMNSLSFGAVARTNFQMIMEKLQQQAVSLSVTVIKDNRTLYTQRITIH
jgi:hypothetical protein